MLRAFSLIGTPMNDPEHAFEDTFRLAPRMSIDIAVAHVLLRRRTVPRWVPDALADADESVKNFEECWVELAEEAQDAAMANDVDFAEAAHRACFTHFHADVIPIIGSAYHLLSGTEGVKALC